MSQDLANLQIQVDAQSAKLASDALAVLTKEGGKAETAIRKLNAASKDAASAEGERTATVGKLADSEEKVSKVMLRSGEMTWKYIESLNKLEAAKARIVAGNVAAFKEGILEQKMREIGAVEKQIAKEAELLAIRTREFKSGILEQKMREIGENEKLIAQEKNLLAIRTREFKSSILEQKMREIGMQEEAAKKLLYAHGEALAMNEKFNASLVRQTLTWRQAAHAMRSFALDVTGMAFLIGGFVTLLSAPAALGVKLLSTLENTRLGMAAILVSMGRINGEAFGLPKALEIAGRMSKTLVSDSLKYGVSITTLADTLRATLAPGLAAGLNLKQIQEIATIGTIAVKTIGLDSKQTVQEIRDLVAGGITAASSTLATSLGVRDSDIKRWREAGTLYTELLAKMKGFSDAAEESTKTLSGAWEILQTKVALLLSDEAGFGAVKDLVMSLSDSIGHFNKQTGQMEFSPEAIAAAENYWALLKGILGTLNLIGAAFKKTSDLGEYLGKTAAEADNEAARRQAERAGGNMPGVPGAPTPRTEQQNRDLFRQGERDLSFAGDDVTGDPLNRLRGAEEFWKKYAKVTREGLDDLHKENVLEFKRHDELLKKIEGKTSDTVEGQKKNDEANLRRRRAFNNAVAGEEQKYQEDIKRLDKDKNKSRDDFLKVWADQVAADLLLRHKLIEGNDREVASINRATAAIELNILKRGQSRGDAEREAAQRDLSKIDVGPLLPGMEKALRGSATMREAQGGLFDAEDETNRMIKEAQNVAAEWKSVASMIKESLGDAFGEGGKALTGFLGAFAEGSANIASIEATKQQRIKDDKENTELYTQQAARDSELATVKSYAGMAEAAQGFFKKNSDGYKAMVRVEQTMRAIQFAMAVKAMATDFAAGATKMFGQSGWGAFAGIAAMAALLSSLGGRSGGGGGAAPASAESLQKSQGTGSVLGDSSAKSQSLTNAFEEVSKNSGPMLEYTRQMADALRELKSSIERLAVTAVRQLDANFSTSGLGLGTSGKWTGLIGALLGNRKKTTSLFAQGYEFSDQALGDAIQGIQGGTYQTVKTKKEGDLFNKSKTTYSTTTGELSDELSSGIQAVLGDMRKSILGAASILGIQGSEVALDAMVIKLGKIDITGLTGEQIQKEFTEVFGKVFGDMAEAVYADVTKFQKNGEDPGDTLIRVAQNYATVDVGLAAIGVTLKNIEPKLIDFPNWLGAIGEALEKDYNKRATEEAIAANIEMRESLIDAFGSLEAFNKGIDFFQKNFMTASEVTTIMAAQVGKAMADLGYAGVDTRDEFKDLFLSLNDGSEASAKLLAQLSNLAPAFDAVAKAAEKLASQRLNLEIRLMEVSGDTMGALAAKRKLELAALDPSLRALQEQIWAQEDLTTVYDKASASLQKLKLLTTDSFKNLFDYTKYLHQAVKAGVPGAEAALPPSARNTYIPGKTTADPNAAVVAQIAKLREELKAGNLALAEYQRQTAAILRRWEGNGMPEVRNVA